MPTSLPLEQQSATALVAQMQQGQLTCQQVLNAHLERIEASNPRLNAIITLVPELAQQRAVQLDAMPLAQRAQLPLFGLPIAHKDLSLTAGVRTTLGSPIFKDQIPSEDSLQVSRLKAAGTIMLGKTNTPEFGAGSQTFNTLFGATRNPYDDSKTCGGSSGGAAVALASRMLPIADGSDLGGSLRNPAAFCNVVGLRPSMGRVPSWPIQNAWNSFPTEGPMARSVDDIALLLSAMAGPDPRSPIAIAEPGNKFSSFTGAPDLRGKRIAFDPDFGGQLAVEPEIIAALQRLVLVLKELGAEVVEDVFDFSQADPVFDTQRAWMFANGFGELLKKHPTKLKDTVIWNIQRGQALTTQDVATAERLRTELFVRLQTWMHSYDALLLPTTQVLPFDVTQEYVTHINGEEQTTYLDWMKSCSRITVTGHPALSLPAGFHNGLPIGLQLVGKHGGDLELLQLAHPIEQATLYAQQLPPDLT